jgi:hypothetical protein
MRRFVLGWKMLGLEQSVDSRIVTYADDLVILCRKGKAEEAQLHECMKLCILCEFREPCIEDTWVRTATARGQAVINLNGAGGDRASRRCAVDTPRRDETGSP